MKNLQLPGICLTLLFCCATAAAQQRIPVNEPDHNKPKLFSNLPDKIPLLLSDLQSFINTATGNDINLKLTGRGLKEFSGRVVSAEVKYNNIRSVVIRSANFNGATFTLSSSAQPDGTVKFTGRILSPAHADLYVLQKENDQYVLIRKNYYDLINE